jgi:hypothetical protein
MARGVGVVNAKQTRQRLLELRDRDDEQAEKERRELETTLAWNEHQRESRKVKGISNDHRH